MASTPESKSIKAEEAEVTSERQGQPEERKDVSLPLPLPPEIEVAFPLARQSSIYSLTIDEIQNTICEQGKNFGSMNMDEFITNIWNVEEGVDGAGAQVHPTGASAPLNRQGSLSLPSPLCRKTVDEVWTEIRREQHQGRQQRQQQPKNVDRLPARRQPTLGEMTLEDFLVKAGVVREGFSHGASGGTPAPRPLPVSAFPQYGLANYVAGTEIGHVMGIGAAAYGSEHRNGVYGGLVAKGRCYAAATATAAAGGCGGCGSEGMMGDGYVAGGLQMAGMFESPASPISSEEMCGDEVRPLDAYGLGTDGGPQRNGGGRKRMTDGTLKVVVDRRQRRMIKNRESAARSRARKQAYTVELEAELNHLKEENSQLREEERRVLDMRRQMLMEAMAEMARSNVLKNGGSLRRCNSSPY